MSEVDALKRLYGEAEGTVMNNTDNLESARVRLDDPPPSAEAVAASLAYTAAAILDKDPGRLDSAAWRLADALLILGELDGELPGVGEPTGRGAQLRHRGKAEREA